MTCQVAVGIAVIFESSRFLDNGSVSYLFSHTPLPCRTSFSVVDYVKERLILQMKFGKESEIRDRISQCRPTRSS